MLRGKMLKFLKDLTAVILKKVPLSLGPLIYAVFQSFCLKKKETKDLIFSTYLQFLFLEIKKKDYKDLKRKFYIFIEIYGQKNDPYYIFVLLY